MAIQLLPPQLANQIAAGEVVERPASVVKELIENSLDAGADRIELDIEKGGHKRIKIRDNGSGIPKDELALALSRHATSKIATLDDLEQILSLGFRGEALASISSVSRLTLTSKPASQDRAWQASCEGRDMAVTVQPAAHPDGTTIDVADLFYNTPARRKFLRTEKTEFQHIEDVLRRISLSHPHVSFLLRHNGKSIKRYMAGAQSERLREERVRAVAGKAFFDNAIYVSTDYEGIRLEAWLGNERALRSSNDCQFSFVNNRGMRDKLILHAIRQAYESVWGVMEQPAFVVYLSLDPKEVDVNVHPAKHEVRFQQSRLVHDFICKAVCDALGADEGSESTANVSYAEPRHDYMQPLQNQSGELSRAPSNIGYINDRSATGAGAGRQSMPRPSGSNREYQAAYQALMTPNGNTSQEDNSACTILPLGKAARLMSKGDQVALIDVTAVVAHYLSSLWQAAERSQPLLMPVAVDAADFSTVDCHAWEAHHMIISRAGGKLRLQQVPAGMRSLPWVRLFPLFLQHPAESAMKNLATIIGQIAPLPETVAHDAWSWFDQLPQHHQWEWISDFGKVRSQDSLIALWDKLGDWHE